DVALEEDRQDDEARRRGAAEAGAEAHVVRRDVVKQDAALLARALPDEPLADPERQRRFGFERVTGEQLEPLLLVGSVEQVEGAAMRGDDRRQLGQDEPTD